MSSTQFANIELEFEPAWIALVPLAAGLLALVLAISLQDWPLLTRGALALAVIFLGAHGLFASANGLARSAVQRAVWSADGAWRLVDGAGRECQAKLDSATRCWSRLGFIVWDDGRTRYRAIVTAGSVGPDAFRRLRVRMRYELPFDNRTCH